MIRPGGAVRRASVSLEWRTLVVAIFLLAVINLLHNFNFPFTSEQ
jgi:hypothetical protein